MEQLGKRQTTVILLQYIMSASFLTDQRKLIVYKQTM